MNNAGGPPGGDFRKFSREDWLKAIDANMLAPIEMIKSTIDGMIARRFGRIVNITSVSVKAPFSSLGLSNGARTGLTSVSSPVWRATSPVTTSPSTTSLPQAQFSTAHLRRQAAAAAKAGQSADDVLEEWRAGEISGRLGDPAEFGMVCAFLCGANAGYITGQNLLLDGGTYPGDVLTASLALPAPSRRSRAIGAPATARRAEFAAAIPQALAARQRHDRLAHDFLALVGRVVAGVMRSSA